VADDVELYIYRKRELETDRVPDGWEDPEGLTRVPAHHRVMWLTNPLSWGDEDPVRAYVLVGRRVAGYVALIPGEVWLRGEPVPVLWGFNLVVSPSFRGKGLAIRLIQAWQNAHHTAIGTHVNQISVGIYRKLSWVEFHYPCYTLIRRSRRFLAGYVPGPVAAAAAPLVDAGLAARRALTGLVRRDPRDLRVERVESMPRELDPALSRPSALVVTHRSAAWFDWQLRARDAAEGIQFRLCLVRDRGDGVVGYFLVQLRRWPALRERFRDVLLGSVREWGVFDEARIDHLSLYLLASREARAMGAEAVHMTVADPAAGAGLKQRGYVEVQPLRTVFFAHPSSPLAAAELRDVRAWRTTAAEADGLVI
jgi:GNAT superfamily N-acetyltransferase